eukprot:Pompholyxophrys_punicea_v1_NODE_49_length_4365_cov_16.421810.p1 type:complete len:148 gc:universal NODE_49_length_4365_cov_16.421810:2415-1972(-)
MVSDFICEEIGYLQLSPSQFEAYKQKQATDPQMVKLDSPKARVLFEYGKNRSGYWGHEHLAKQLTQAMAMHEFLFPDYEALFVLDNSSGHLAFAKDALVASKMNVFPGGEQPYIRPTLWQGQEQIIGKRGLKEVFFFLILVSFLSQK